MQLIKFKTLPLDSPFRVYFSLENQIKIYEKYAQDESHPFCESSKKVLAAVNKFPELRTGIEDISQLPKYEQELKILFNPLFPEPLQLNEIKAVVVPYKYTFLNLTKRFQNILNNAGDDFHLDFKDWDDSKLYFYACTFILMKYYRQYVDVSRPIFIDIPNQTNGSIRHYRALFNVDFVEITKMENTPELTQADIDELLLRGEDLEFWKSKFPPDSYIVKGFGLMSLYDATNDVNLSKIRSVFLRNDKDVFQEFQGNLADFMGIKDLKVGYSLYDAKTKKSLGGFFSQTSKSIILEEQDKMEYKDLFCEKISTNVLHNTEIIAISDVELYSNRAETDILYQKLNRKGIKSLILVPLKLNNGHIQMLELASSRKNELNSLNAIKLEDIIPFIKIASERFFEESQNVLESTIQENYTSIHPSVKWRFSQAAAGFNSQKIAGVENPVLDDIVFNGIYPLYAQSDIKGSSTARNSAIQTDLELQLSLVIETFQTIMEVQSFPIYQNLIYRVQSYLDHVKQGLKAGDEVSILEFLKREIYPVFNHLKTLNPVFAEAVKGYMSKIDPDLHVVYQQRRSYEDSVNMLNEHLAAYLDKKQEEAQKMFPHYFERYKTDGVEFNMYIGASLVNEESFNLMYLYNLRLWQLETMCELEQLAYDLVDELAYPLRVASLILIHSNPLAIRFSMEQKSFDVDGAYNARYEIIKKRIDKSHIKGTNERLTQPGKIAIVYSQDNDAFEYLNYLKYLQSKNLISEIEMLELEDLQGVSGLKAIRVEVVYSEKRRAVVNGVEQLREVSVQAVPGLT
ncbi:MAG: GAF domain-containing protein [Saprospiraceae bacterium]